MSVYSIGALLYRYAQPAGPDSFFDVGGITVVDLGATGFVGVILWMLLTGKLVTAHERTRLEEEIRVLRELTATQAATLATYRPAVEVSASLLTALQHHVENAAAPTTDRGAT